MDYTENRDTTKRVLKEVFGYDSFRTLQEPIITNILAKRDTLVILPTGGGKSLCYQLPALIFKGLTVVVSPLIALMKDQVGQLHQLGVPAVFINSTISHEEYYRNVRGIMKNEIKLLYVAPETLLKPRTLEMLSSLLTPPDCLTIDEAHCISEWGHDFRPEYRQLAEVRQKFPSAVCIALTATATQRVREDIKKTLHFESCNEFIGSFDRDNLFLKIIQKQEPFRQIQRFLIGRKEQPGIIYCLTRRQVDELTAKLQQQGFQVKPYHAGLTDEERRLHQEMFLRDDIQIIVATVAFGMGINKSNIRFVIHYDLPRNVESYYQEIGRAGRDGLRADCLLLFGYADLAKIRYFIDQKEENERRIASQHLSAMLRYAETDICRRIPLLEYFGEKYLGGPCSMCDNCLEQENQLEDLTIPAQKFLSCVRKTEQIFGAAHIIDILRGSESQKIIKFCHQSLSTYGIGLEFSKKQWFHLSRQFVQKGLLSLDPEFGGLKVTPKGIDVLKGREKFLGVIPEDKEPEKSLPSAKITVDKGNLEGADMELFHRLRQVRKRLADDLRIPPYLIFSDKSLAAMALTHPASPQDLLNVHGVGGAKLKNYGDVFFEAIHHFRLSQNYPATNAPPENGIMNPPAPAGEYYMAGEPEMVVMKSHSFAEVGDAYNQGATIQDLMRMFSLKEERVIDLLIKFVKSGKELAISGLLKYSTLSADLQATIMAEFYSTGAENLDHVYSMLNGQVGYYQLKVMQLYFLACNT